MEYSILFGPDTIESFAKVKASENPITLGGKVLYIIFASNSYVD